MATTVNNPGGTPEIQPVIKLIEEAREELNMTMVEAGELVGFSNRRWSKIVSLSRRRRSGEPMVPMAKTLARMALAVGLSPEAFEGLNPPRSDIAKSMREFRSVTETASMPDDRVSNLTSLLVAMERTWGQRVYRAAVAQAARRIRQEGAEARARARARARKVGT